LCHASPNHLQDETAPLTGEKLTGVVDFFHRFFQHPDVSVAAKAAGLSAFFSVAFVFVHAVLSIPDIEIELRGGFVRDVHANILPKDMDFGFRSSESVTMADVVRRITVSNRQQSQSLWMWASRLLGGCCAVVRP
jgi:hypothetical protein